MFRKRNNRRAPASSQDLFPLSASPQEVCYTIRAGSEDISRQKHCFPSSKTLLTHVRSRGICETARTDLQNPKPTSKSFIVCVLRQSIACRLAPIPTMALVFLIVIALIPTTSNPAMTIS